MSAALLPAALPAADVLPSRVRRRLGSRDAVLAAVLVAELLAGVAARAVWEERGALVEAFTPAAHGTSAPAATTALPAGQTGPLVVAPLLSAPTSSAPTAPPRRTVPRNPFAVQLAPAG